MSQLENRLERRARMLGDAIQQRIASTTLGLRSPGSPPPFTRALSHEKALDWWDKNWNRPAGALALSGMDPQARLRLHLALSQRSAARMGMQQPDQPSVGDPGAAAVLAAGQQEGGTSGNGDSGR